MLSSTARPLIAASVPVLRQHGLAITQHFYREMFAAHPALKNLFNQGNQAIGVQQQSLANAVFAYAAHIDDAAALAPVIERIVHKHASLGVGPQHYPIVGHHLLGAIAAVLGDAATPELLTAWEEAYGLLAGQLIAAEARLYRQSGHAAGELLDLRVIERRRETDLVTSYYLQDAQGRSPGRFRPGQYVSVAVQLDNGLRQLRQYSLSDAPQQPWWRITIKAETGDPAGMVSNHLRQTLRIGSPIAVSPAFGDFAPELGGERPLVLISAGVGITPMVSILNTLAFEESSRPLLFAHAASAASAQVLRADLVAARASLPQMGTAFWYETGDLPAQARAGRMALEQVITPDLLSGEFLLCGPRGFMEAQRQQLLQLGVQPNQIQREVFGPDLLEHLL
ncbi:globin domain-containing protein [Chitinimonas lacunae]|uniref:nitric oxide dioxygenase n=1 Tax=Chitinimonas lacunae TaxID=1963018 RepID=A0ABV8MT25_9NEIS